MKHFYFSTKFASGLAIVMLTVASSAFADLILQGPVVLKGTGFGNVTTVLTMQVTGTAMKSGFESGCVGLNGSGATVTGPSVCQGNNVGGYEKPPDHFPHNSTPTVGDADDIAIVFNADQPSGGPITLNNLVMALYNSSGQAGFTSGNFANPIDFTSTFTGIGKSGFEFTLDTTQAAQAQAAINAGFDILGLSSTATGSKGGPETFFLTSINEASEAADTSAPEPASFALLGSGVLLLGMMSVRRLRKEADTKRLPNCVA